MSSWLLGGRLRILSWRVVEILVGDKRETAQPSFTPGSATTSGGCVPIIDRSTGG